MARPFSTLKYWHHLFRWLRYWHQLSIPAEVAFFLLPSPTWVPHGPPYSLSLSSLSSSLFIVSLSSSPARTLVVAGVSSAQRQLGFLQSGALGGGLSLSVPTAEVLPAQHYAASSLPLGMWRSSCFSVQIGEQRELVDSSRVYSCLPRRATASIAFPTTTKKASSTRGIFNAASCRRYCSPTLAASSELSLCLRGLSLRRRAGSALTPFSKYRSLRRTLSRRFSNFHYLSFSESLVEERNGT